MKFIMNGSNHHHVNPTVRYHVGCLPLQTKDSNSGFTVHDSHIFGWVSGVELGRVDLLFLYLHLENIEWCIKWEAKWATLESTVKSWNYYTTEKYSPTRKTIPSNPHKKSLSELLVSLFLDKLIPSVFSQHHSGWRPFSPSEPKRCSLLDLAFASKLG